MPLWLRRFRALLSGGKFEEHRLEIKVKKIPGQTDADRAVMEREIQAEVFRQLSEGSTPETTQAAIDEIARRHGGGVEDFKET